MKKNSIVKKVNLLTIQFISCKIIILLIANWFVLHIFKHFQNMHIKSIDSKNSLAFPFHFSLSLFLNFYANEVKMLVISDAY